MKLLFHVSRLAKRYSLRKLANRILIKIYYIAVIQKLRTHTTTFMYSTASSTQHSKPASQTQFPFLLRAQKDSIFLSLDLSLSVSLSPPFNRTIRASHYKKCAGNANSSSFFSPFTPFIIDNAESPPHPRPLASRDALLFSGIPATALYPGPSVARSRRESENREKRRHVALAHAGGRIYLSARRGRNVSGMRSLLVYLWIVGSCECGDTQSAVV